MAEISKSFIKENSGPMRLNKYLSDAGFCSRREADRLIESKMVTVDGITAVMGQKVDKGQVVEVNNKKVELNNRLILIAYNKPCGVECTTDPSNDDNIIKHVGFSERIYPIGRLDKASTGLILLTNTGELVNSILKSVNYHEKEYQVRVDKPINDDFIKKMSSGVLLKNVPTRNGSIDITTRKCTVKKTDDHSFTIILTQGINRQIRRMCSAIGYNVTSLHRIRIMNIELGSLKTGSYRKVSESELETLKKMLGNSL